LGINRKSIEELLDAGANVITTGNHAFHWKEWKEVFDNYPMVLFPANYPGLLERSHYTQVASHSYEHTRASFYGMH